MTNDLLPCQCGKAPFVRYGKTDTGTRKFQTSCVACICGMNTGYHEHKTREAFTIWNTRTPNKSAEVDLLETGYAIFYKPDGKIVRGTSMEIYFYKDTAEIDLKRLCGPEHDDYEVCPVSISSGHLATGKGGDECTNDPNGYVDLAWARGEDQQKTAEPCGDIDDLLRNAPMIKNGERPENHRLRMTNWLCKLSAALSQPAAPTQIDAGELEAALSLPINQIGFSELNVIREAARAHLSKLSGGAS